MNFCNNCGNSLEAGQKFCGGCGTIVAAVTQPAATPENIPPPAPTPEPVQPATPASTTPQFGSSHQYQPQAPFGHQPPPEAVQPEPVSAAPPAPPEAPVGAQQPAGAPTPSPGQAPEATQPPVYEQPAGTQTQPGQAPGAAQPPGSQMVPPPVGGTSNFRQQFEQAAASADTTEEYDPQDIADNKIMAVLAYFGILVLIPIFAAPNSRFARFHANQGLILLIIGVIYSVLTRFLLVTSLNIAWWLYTVVGLLLSVLGLVLLAFAIIGIINAAKGRAKDLPLFGSFRILN